MVSTSSSPEQMQNSNNNNDNFSSISFSDDHPFSYKKMFNERKEIPIVTQGKIEYNCIFNGGWLRIRTINGWTYHITQARLFHLLPDWKLHFSIDPVDFERAWNIIGKLFIEKQCNMTMKMKVPDYDGDNWQPHMHGREITVYIYRHKEIYKLLSYGTLTKDDQLPVLFWWSFIEEAEKRLSEANIKSRGTANGDRPIGKYCSLRNEAFIEVDQRWQSITIGHELSNICEYEKTKYCYPPNISGYNPSGNKDFLFSSHLPRVVTHPIIMNNKKKRNKVIKRLILELEKMENDIAVTSANLAATALTAKVDTQSDNDIIVPNP